MKKNLWLMVALLSGTVACAHAETVVVVNPSAGPLTKEQIADIFLGKDTSYLPVDLPESAPLRADFYKKVTGRDLNQVKATWTRLVFSGKAKPPKEVADATGVKKAVTQDAKAIGYIDKSAVDDTVKVIMSLE